MTDKRRFEVELMIEGSLYVEVEAEDEDEARDLARDAWREDCSTGDVEVDTVQSASVRELAL